MIEHQVNLQVGLESIVCPTLIALDTSWSQQRTQISLLNKDDGSEIAHMVVLIAGGIFFQVQVYFRCIKKMLYFQYVSRYDSSDYQSC